MNIELITKDETIAKLSPAEKDVFIFAVSTLKIEDIAKELEISPHAVRFHLTAIYKKLCVKSRADLLLRFANSTQTNERLILYLFQMQKEIDSLKECVKNSLPLGLNGN